MPSAMALKERISSPLEAGPSILDAHHLPPHLTPALEYTSSRLAKKALHLTLVIVRRDYQLPTVVSPHGSPAFPSPTTPGSPPLTGGSTGSGRFGFTSSPVVALKQLVRSASAPFSSNRPSELSRSAMSSPAGSATASESPSPKFRWPLSPTTPLSPPPMTPCTASSINTSDSGGPPTPNSAGLRFFYPSDMSPKTERVLRHTLTKAGSKFGIGSSWLTSFSSPTTQDLTNRLFQNSVVQNEVLFSSDGLTLLSLDRLYSVKSALSSYSKTTSPLRLEDAVDELRRFVLASNGNKVSRSDLLRSYDWLSVSNSAISDLDRMYRRAYGGPERTGGISGMPLERIPEPVVKELSLSIDDDDDSSLTPSDMISDESIGVAMTVVQVFKPPSPRRISPLPKLQTNFAPKPKIKVEAEDKGRDQGNATEDGDRTARPTDRSTMNMWNKHFTIDQVLSADALSPDRGSMAMGPITPNAYDDISPITRGEWGFLMSDNGLKDRIGAVETC